MSNTVTSPSVDAATATTAAPAPAKGRPASSYGAAPHDPSKPPVKRQIVCFSFYKVMPEWRRLPAEEKAAHKAAFAEVLEKWNKPGEFLSLTYSIVEIHTWIAYVTFEEEFLFRPPSIRFLLMRR